MTRRTNPASPRLEEILSRRIMILDGSMGALIYTYKLTEQDVRGSRFARHSCDLKNCTEVLVATQPRLIEEIHRAYLEAGADIIETDTFNGTAVSLEEFGLQEHVHELNRTAAELARHAADEFTRKDPDRPRFVAGSIGPTKKQLSMGIHVEDPGRRDVTFDEMVANYKTQIRAPGGGRGRPAAAGNFVRHAGAESLPVRHRCVLRGDGHPAAGDDLGNDFRQPPDALGPAGRGVLLFGFALRRPERGTELRRGCRADARLVESLAAICRTRISCYPNAGMPDGFGGFLGDKDHTAQVLGEFARNGWLNIVGGCCGTTPEWISAIARAVEGVPPRQVPDLPHWSNYSGMEPLVIRPETNFVMIGERTNITGSKKFARLIKSGDYEAAADRRPRAGRERRQHHRRQHGRGADRRREGHDPVSQPGLGRPGHRQGPDHDRQLQIQCHRGRAEVRAGQVDRQLDQPEGGRGEVPRPGPAGPPLRRGGRGDGLRRDRPGGRQRTPRWPSASGPTSC